MSEKPNEIIYLQCWDEWGDFIRTNDNNEVTWCNGNVNGNDEPYIRMSIFVELLNSVKEHFQSNDSRKLQIILDKLTSTSLYVNADLDVENAGKNLFDIS